MDKKKIAITLRHNVYATCNGNLYTNENNK